MFIDRVVGEFRIAGGADGVPCLFQRTTPGCDTGRRAIGAFHEIAGAGQRAGDGILADQRATATGRNRVHVEGRNVIQGLAPVAEMPVAAIAGGMILDDIAGEHHVFVRHMDHDIARRMGAAQMHQINAPVAQIDGHAFAEGRGGPCQPRYAFVAFEKARKALEFAVPVLLPALGHHGARHIAHNDLIRTIGRRPQHPDRMIMGQRQMGDRLVGHAADLFDDLMRQTRGRLRLHDHHAVVADDHTGIRVALGGKGPDVAAHFLERDLLFGHVPLGRECLAHASAFTV